VWEFDNESYFMKWVALDPPLEEMGSEFEEMSEGDQEPGEE
jgi:hypothetical protein